MATTPPPFGVADDVRRACVLDGLAHQGVPKLVATVGVEDDQRELVEGVAAHGDVSPRELVDGSVHAAVAPASVDGTDTERGAALAVVTLGASDAFRAVLRLATIPPGDESAEHDVKPREAELIMEEIAVKVSGRRPQMLKNNQVFEL